MPSYIEKAEQLTLPVTVLHGTVAFPQITVNFETDDEASSAAMKAAANGNALLFLVSSSEEFPASESPDPTRLYRVGTVAHIKQMLRLPNGSARIIAEGRARALVTEYRSAKNHLEASVICKTISLPDHGGVRGTAVTRELLTQLEKNLRYAPAGSANLLTTARIINNPGTLADFIAANILSQVPDKQTILECFDPFRRAETLLMLLQQESLLMREEARLRRKVNARMNRNQHEYYLREQIKAIQEELGEMNSEAEEYAERIRQLALPEEAEAKLLRETERLSRVSFGSAEATVIANYLDICLSLPWKKATRDRLNAAAVQKALDADHDGMKKVKERIVEYIAAKQFSPTLRNQILCLVGPPGVGKTSVAASIARAMNRKYVRISLGGVRDEAEIRGHRKTYVGSMPGRSITALTQAGGRNPLILLDEIDKMSRDGHGDPTSAMLEVLDGEQNKAFRDHYVELPFDLSDCMFLATANTLEGIPRPLIDRMEIIEMDIYTRSEKLSIARNHLIPKQLSRHGLNRRTLKITDEAVCELIDFYTHEAGVRQLERAIASLCRKADRRLLDDKQTRRLVIDRADVASYLGGRKRLPETLPETDEVGCVNGLAYTELGGTLLQVEVAVLEGSGKIETTGSLGDVMKESAQIAVSYVRSVAGRYGIPADFYKTRDLHIHFPEGATPKDGPSAGVTMVTALVSALTGRPVRRDLAMTGEITLRGRVLPIGGLKEKTMAAYTAGIRTVLIPAENQKDLEELDPTARENLTLIPCRSIEEVLAQALLPLPRPAEALPGTDTVAASLYVSDEPIPDAPVPPPQPPQPPQMRI